VPVHVKCFTSFLSVGSSTACMLSLPKPVLSQVHTWGVGSRTPLKRLVFERLQKHTDQSLVQKIAAHAVLILACPLESLPKRTPHLRNNSHGQQLHNAPLSRTSPPLIAPTWEGPPPARHDVTTRDTR
jgi:hypothetical protein